MANPHVTIALATGIGIARNAIIARAAFALVALGGGYGTISGRSPNAHFALQFDRAVVGLAGAPDLPGVQALAKNAAATCSSAVSTDSHGGELARRRAVERDVALEHGQEALGIRRVAGLDHRIQDQAALAGGQVKLVALRDVAAALGPRV